MCEQAAEHLPGPLCVGIRKRRARHLFAAQMVEPGGVALQTWLDLTQLCAPTIVRTSARINWLFVVRVRTCLSAPCSATADRSDAHGTCFNRLVEYTIVVLHGLILLPCPKNVAKRLEHRRINAMHLVHQI